MDFESLLSGKVASAVSGGANGNNGHSEGGSSEGPIKKAQSVDSEPSSEPKRRSRTILDDIPLQHAEVDTPTIREYLRYLSLYTPGTSDSNPTNELTYEDDTFCVSLMDIDSKGVIPGYGVKFAHVGEIIELASEWAGKATLHITLNDTDHRGRRSENIKAARVLCMDIDRKIDNQELVTLYKELKPTMVVESSPGKYHFYWRLDPSVTLDQWRVAQLGLAWKFGADLDLSVVSKMIRVPGLARRCKDGRVHMPDISTPNVVLDRIDWEAIRTRWPDIAAWCAKGNAARVERDRLLAAKVKKLRKAKTPEARVKALKDIGSLGQGQRNVGMFNVVRDIVSAAPEEMTEEDALAAVEPMYEAMEHPIPRDEFLKTLKSGWKYGLERWTARQEEVAAAQRALDELLDEDTGEGEGEPSLEEELGLGKGSAGKTAGAPSFNYDYHEPSLRVNRFTDRSVQVRVLQRYGEKLASVDGSIFAFSEKQRLWKQQTYSSHPEIFGWVNNCSLDVMRDPEFIKVLCMDAEGQFSAHKQRKLQEKYQSVGLHMSTAKAVLQAPSIKVVPREIFDSQEGSILCGNGVLDLVSGEVREPQASDYLLNGTSVPWEPTAKCDEWLEFLGEVFARNEEPQKMVDFMQEVFGYSLSGSVKEEKIFCHYGGGANGKSKTLQALLKVCGSYGTILDPDELSSKKGTFARTFEKFASKIEFRRCAVVDDIDVDTVWNESFVKNVTGPRIRMRAEYEKSRERTNRCKIHLGLNIAPEPEAENHGILRRLCIIPYNRRFEHKPGESGRISDMIEREASGILCWARDGYVRVLKQNGILYPQETILALEEYQSEHFNLESALNAMYEPSDNEWLSMDEVIGDLREYAERVGDIPPEQISKERIGRILKMKCKTKRTRAKGDYQRYTTSYGVHRRFKKQDPSSML